MYVGGGGRRGKKEIWGKLSGKKLSFSLGFRFQNNMVVNQVRDKYYIGLGGLYKYGSEEGGKVLIVHSAANMECILYRV